VPNISLNPESHMLEKRPIYTTWPTQGFQRTSEVYSIADFATPRNGVDPKQLGWVYVKVDVWTEISKVGYTDGQLASRLTETGNPNLVIHTAFHVPGGYAFQAEAHCHLRLNTMNMVPHLMTGQRSEFFHGGAQHITQMVEQSLDEFYEHVAGSVGRRFCREETQFTPQYNPHGIGHNGSIQAPYWQHLFDIAKFHAQTPPPQW
jgi:hypothetical protein